MKIINFILIAVSIFSGTGYAAEDQGKGMPTAWELLIVDPNSRKEKRIQLDGYLKVDVLDKQSYRFRLFMDMESLKKNRDFRFVEIDSLPFLEALKASGLGDAEKIKKLDQKYVTMKAHFEVVPTQSKENFLGDEYRVGNIKGPYLCWIPKSDTLILTFPDTNKRTHKLPTPSNNNPLE